MANGEFYLDLESEADAGKACLPPWPLSFFPPRELRLPGYSYEGSEDATQTIDERFAASRSLGDEEASARRGGASASLSVPPALVATQYLLNLHFRC